jgi:hypothetical protein
MEEEEEEEAADEVKRKLARLSLVLGPVLVRYPATCRLDDNVVLDVLRAPTAMATTVQVQQQATPAALAMVVWLLRLSPMAGRLNRAVGRHPCVEALYAKARER